MNGENKPKLLVTASTFPRWAGDTEPRFVLDLCVALKKYSCTGSTGSERKRST